MENQRSLSQSKSQNLKRGIDREKEDDSKAKEIGCSCSTP
jgi:hypothetical protein